MNPELYAELQEAFREAFENTYAYYEGSVVLPENTAAHLDFSKLPEDPSLSEVKGAYDALKEALSAENPSPEQKESIVSATENLAHAADAFLEQNPAPDDLNGRTVRRVKARLDMFKNMLDVAFANEEAKADLMPEEERNRFVNEMEDLRPDRIKEKMDQANAQYSRELENSEVLKSLDFAKMGEEEKNQAFLDYENVKDPFLKSARILQEKYWSAKEQEKTIRKKVDKLTANMAKAEEAQTKLTAVKEGFDKASETFAKTLAFTGDPEKERIGGEKDYTLEYARIKSRYEQQAKALNRRAQELDEIEKKQKQYRAALKEATETYTNAAILNNVYGKEVSAEDAKKAAENEKRAIGLITQINKELEAGQKKIREKQAEIDEAKAEFKGYEEQYFETNAKIEKTGRVFRKLIRDCLESAAGNMDGAQKNAREISENLENGRSALKEAQEKRKAYMAGIDELNAIGDNYKNACPKGLTEAKEKHRERLSRELECLFEKRRAAADRGAQIQNDVKARLMNWADRVILVSGRRGLISNTQEFDDMSAAAKALKQAIESGDSVEQLNERIAAAREATSTYSRQKGARSRWTDKGQARLDLAQEFIENGAGYVSALTKAEAMKSIHSEAIDNISQALGQIHARQITETIRDNNRPVPSLTTENKIISTYNFDAVIGLDAVPYIPDEKADEICVVEPFVPEGGIKNSMHMDLTRESVEKMALHNYKKQLDDHLKKVFEEKAPVVKTQNKDTVKKEEMTFKK